MLSFSLFFFYFLPLPPFHFFSDLHYSHVRKCSFSTATFPSSTTLYLQLSTRKVQCYFRTSNPRNSYPNLSPHLKSILQRKKIKFQVRAAIPGLSTRPLSNHKILNCTTFEASFTQYLSQHAWTILSQSTRARIPSLNSPSAFDSPPPSLVVPLARYAYVPTALVTSRGQHVGEFKQFCPLPLFLNQSWKPTEYATYLFAGSIQASSEA